MVNTLAEAEASCSLRPWMSTYSFQFHCIRCLLHCVNFNRIRYFPKRPSQHCATWHLLLNMHLTPCVQACQNLSPIDRIPQRNLSREAVGDYLIEISRIIAVTPLTFSVPAISWQRSAAQAAVFAIFQTQPLSDWNGRAE